jgi:hypothetical protein
MDEGAFDSLARSAATWTTRRRAIGALISAAVASAFHRPGQAFAQNTTPPGDSCAPGETCAPAGNPDDVHTIATKSAEWFQLIPLPDVCVNSPAVDGNTFWRSRMCQLPIHFGKLFQRGSQAEADKWNQREVVAFYSDLNSIVPTLGFGLSLGTYSLSPATPEAGGNGSSDASTCTPVPTCATACLHKELDCYQNTCALNDPCIDTSCVGDFVDCVFKKHDGQASSCYDQFMQYCQIAPDHCCGGACHP